MLDSGLISYKTKDKIKADNKGKLMHMANLQIKFMHNWNDKLDNPLFTTIRNYNENKLVYYSESVGKVFSVLLKDKEYCRAELIDAWFYKIYDLPAPFIALDTGITDYPEAIKLFRKFGVREGTIVLLFKKKD